MHVKTLHLSDKMLLYLVTWRLVWAVLSQTWYVPDETWQSVEVAHRSVWGRGQLTWEADLAIRSSLQSLPHAVLFKLLALLRLDFQFLVVLLPRMMTGLLTALGDHSFYQFVRRREGRGCASWLLLLVQTNWFLLYSGSRTVINTAEMSLLSLGISLYPGPSFLSVVALSVMLRPTLVIVWTPLVLKYLFKVIKYRGVLRLIKTGITPILVASSIGVIDSIFYGKITLTPLNFFQVNIVHNLGSFYGTNPHTWYLSHALLPILGPLFPLALISLVRDSSELKWPVLTTLVAFSTLEHKEMRFIQPVLPLLLFFAAKQLYRMTGSPPTSTWLLLVSAINLPLALYLSLVHQRGVVDAALWLGSQSNISSAVYLMPCHSAPMYSHTHRLDIQLEYLTCLPNLDKDPQHVEEVEMFYSEPEYLISSKYSSYDCLIMFDSLLKRLKNGTDKNVLDKLGFKDTQTFFHTHFPEGRVDREIHAMCK